MEKLFGVPMSGLALGLAGTLVAALLVVGVMALRSRIFVKLGVRNIPRRPAQTVLIVIGLMLSTMIIAASLGVGDTVTHSIRSTVLDGLGHTDETIRSSQLAIFGDDYIDEAQVAKVKAIARGDERIDGVLPQIREVLPVLATRTSRTEARTVVAGFDLGSLQGFGELRNAAGKRVSLTDLGPGELYLNPEARRRLDARPGDEVVLITPTGRHSMTVRDVLRTGGLAGADPRALMPLAPLQEILDRQGQVNRIDISNRGGVREGRDLSEEVTKDLRLQLADPEVSRQLFELLKGEKVARALEERAEKAKSLPGTLSEDLRTVAAKLRKGAPDDEFRSLIADDATGPAVLIALETGGMKELLPQAAALMAQLQDLRVTEIKVNLLTLADAVGNLFTTVFGVLGSFSIIVGLLLIFLVFVMLAAARSMEMGLTRAIGAKRRHLVQMFTFEGAVYALLAGAVGTGLGILASLGLVALLSRAFGEQDQTFVIRHSFQLRSVVAAFSAGVLLTLLTVAISAYRVSRLDIVVAIRGLNAEFVQSKTSSFRARLWGLARALFAPVTLLVGGARGLRAARRGEAGAGTLRGRLLSIAAGATLLALLAASATSPDRAALGTPAYAVIGIWGAVAAYRLASPYFKQGWPLVVVGLLIAIGGVRVEQVAPWSIGVSIFLIGVALALRLLLRRTRLTAHAQARICHSFLGLALLVFWSLPFDALDGITGKLNGSIEMFILSGVWMVGAAVWLVMHNADILLWILDRLLGRLGSLKPVLLTAIAYPMAAKFRTGLTVAMFSLIIFTLMVFAIMNNLGNALIDDPDRVTGGYDIRATISSALPIEDIEGDIKAAPELDAADFEVVARAAKVPAEARQTGAEEASFKNLDVQAVDDTFLATNLLEMSHYDPGYGTTPRAIWEALRNDPSLAVVTASALPQEGGGFGGFVPAGFQVEGIKPGGPEEIKAFDVEVRPRRSKGDAVTMTVIAVLDPIANGFETDQRGGPPGPEMLASAAILAEFSDPPAPFTIYKFRLRDGAPSRDIAARLETVFLDHSMQAVSADEMIEQNRSQSDAFNQLFQGFMGLGLLVGVAALGVLSFRAVVERRQQIGMMRAIGFKGRMIQAQFLLESSFVALLGVSLGLGLGTLISWNIVNDLSDQVEGLVFVIPWFNVAVIVVIAIAFSLATTFWPARQASRIYPSEALRYE